MYVIDPNYEQYAMVREGYNAPFIVIQETGEAGVWLTLSAAKRLYEVLPDLIADLSDQIVTFVDG